MYKLTYLNLSCNKIQQIGSFKMLQQLKTLVLSHNRITSILPLEEMGEYCRLEVLEMTDNYVGELSQIKCLQDFKHLKNLSFRKIGEDSKGNNPICDFANYQITVKMYCHSLKHLDGQPLGSSTSQH